MTFKETPFAVLALFILWSLPADAQGPVLPAAPLPPALAADLKAFQEGFDDLAFFLRRNLSSEKQALVEDAKAKLALLDSLRAHVESGIREAGRINGEFSITESIRFLARTLRADTYDDLRLKSDTLLQVSSLVRIKRQCLRDKGSWGIGSDGLLGCSDPVAAANRAISSGVTSAGASPSQAAPVNSPR